MDTVKKKPTPKERKEATAELRKYHQSTFDALGNPDAIYIPKMAHFVTDLEGIHMGFFESELGHEQDVYTEKVSKFMEPEDPDRTLYKLRNNPHFKDEYPPSEPMPNGHVRYFVPVVELEAVDVNNLVETSDYSLVDPDEDPPLTDMTIRDMAALMLRAPVSRRPWLNQLIKNLDK
jgi:hypothetical protein